MTYADLGENLKEEKEEQWQTPLDTKRDYTDSLFLAFFSIFVGFWLIMGLYVLLVDDTIKIHYSTLLRHDEIFLLSKIIEESFYEARWPIFGFLSMAVLLLAVFIAMFRWLTKILVFITIFIMCAMLALITALMVVRVYRKPAALLELLPLSIVITLFSVTLYSFRKIGTEPVCKVIRMSCKAMFFFPSTLLVTLLQFSMHLFVIGFSAAVFLLLRTVSIPQNLDHFNMTEIEANDPEELVNENDPNVVNQIIDIGLPAEHVVYFQVINLWGLIWIYNFFAGLGRMVLTATFATWYYTEDKSRISVNTVPKCISVIIQHHLGTVAYGSSLFTIFPMIYIVFKHGREKLKEIYKQPSCVLAWLTVLAKFSFDALAICAVHGSTFYKSAKDSYILLMKNPLSFLTINFISECVIFIGLLLLPIATLTATMMYVCYESGCNVVDSIQVTIILVVFMVSTLMSLTFFSVFRAASNTIRYCYLQDSKFSHEAEMGMYEIHLDDSSVKV